MFLVHTPGTSTKIFRPESKSFSNTHRKGATLYIW